MKNKKILIVASILIYSLSSCSKYIINRQGGGCGVWYPRIFNPDRADKYENPRGVQGWRY